MVLADLHIATSEMPVDGSAELAGSMSEMVEIALSYCEKMTGCRERDQMVEALRADNPVIHDYFRYSIAQQLARYLSALDQSVVSVYTYSFEETEEEGEERHVYLAAPINLILHVRRKTAALRSIVTYLDHQLLDQYKRLVAPEGGNIASILDVQMVDDEDIRRGTGFGVVLRSSFSRPMRLWPE